MKATIEALKVRLMYKFPLLLFVVYLRSYRYEMLIDVALQRMKS